METLIPETLRIDKMTEAVFAGRSLRELKQAVQEMLELFYDIVTEPIDSYAELKMKLSSVNEKHWDKIRSIYLQDEDAGYCNGDFTECENDSVVKILLDLVSMMERCSKLVVNKVEEKQQEMREKDFRMNTLENQIKKLEEVMESQKSFYTEKVSENNDLATRNMHLLNQISEKNKQISELERTNNAQLWEKEKQKLLLESSNKISALEQELDSLQSQNKSYKEKVTCMEAQLKQLRLKTQLSQERTSSPAPSDEDDHIKLSKQNYMQDKDIVYLEKKLYELQTSTVGVIGGMKTDFKQLAHKFIDPELGEVDEEFKLLSKRMDRVYKAVADSDVDSAKNVLPPHYRYIQDENFKVKKIKRLSQPVITAPQRLLNNSLDDKKPVLKPIAPSSNHRTALNGIKEVPTNPVIIDPKTKRLHPINPLKYFPFMSQQFIKEQFEKFKRYDTNGNGSLDLDEMVGIVKDIGFDFNIHQLQEAMEEVDRDHNQSLDFFEYMLIIDNIYRKQGKAELFQKGMKEVRRNNMSKTCVVQ